MLTFSGGGSGIGLMATQALVANGAKVYITGRTGEKLDKVGDIFEKKVQLADASEKIYYKVRIRSWPSCVLFA